jgi:hypothetical protein
MPPRASTKERDQLVALFAARLGEEQRDYRAGMIAVLDVVLGRMAVNGILLAARKRQTEHQREVKRGTEPE